MNLSKFSTHPEALIASMATRNRRTNSIRSRRPPRVKLHCARRSVRPPAQPGSSRVRSTGHSRDASRGNTRLRGWYARRNSSFRLARCNNTQSRGGGCDDDGLLSRRWFRHVAVARDGDCHGSGGRRTTPRDARTDIHDRHHRRDHRRDTRSRPRDAGCVTTLQPLSGAHAGDRHRPGRAEQQRNVLRDARDGTRPRARFSRIARRPRRVRDPPAPPRTFTAVRTASPCRGGVSIGAVFPASERPRASR